MELAHNIIVYAWIGWAVIMLQTAVVLVMTSWLIAKMANTIWSNMAAIYRIESMRYYFDKMEKEGTHAFKIKPSEIETEDDL